MSCMLRHSLSLTHFPKGTKVHVYQHLGTYQDEPLTT